MLEVVHLIPHPPSVRPSVQSARHWLVDRPAADLEACCWLERWLHVEWTVRFSFSISICEDTNTQKGDYNTGKVDQLWICQLSLSSRFSRHHPCCEARCWRHPAVVGFRELEWQWSYVLEDDLSWAANVFDKVCSHTSMWIYNGPANFSPPAITLIYETNKYFFIMFSTFFHSFGFDCCYYNYWTMWMRTKKEALFERENECDVISRYFFPVSFPFLGFSSLSFHGSPS